MTDPFHEVAVARNNVSAMIDEPVSEPCIEDALCHRHADRVGDSLAERPGSGLDSGGVAVFRVTGAGASDLAEISDVLDADVAIAGQVEQRIKQHGAVAGRKYEAVTVGPIRIGRVEFEKARKQHGRGVGHAQRQSGMSRFRRLDSVHRQRADRIREPADGCLLRQSARPDHQSLRGMGRGLSQRPTGPSSIAG
jgi:hypothetical protein